MTPCVSCSRPLIDDCCPECDPGGFVRAMFERECSPAQFVSPAHYGAWMRREPLVVRGDRPKVNGRWKAVVFRQYGHRCIHCSSTTLLTFGHLIPWSVGGNDSPSNGVPECQRCNQRQYPPLAAYLARKAAA